MKSASVPDVDTRILARIGPAIVTFSASGSLWYVSTSGRVDANHWSSTIQRKPCVGRFSVVKGTGCTGSST